jgi:hypothetical protein
MIYQGHDNQFREYRSHRPISCLGTSASGLTVSARRLPDPVPGICYETHPIASG